MLVELFKNIAGCVSDPTKVIVHFWGTRHECGNIFQRFRINLYSSNQQTPNLGGKPYITILYKFKTKAKKKSI